MKHIIKGRTTIQLFDKETNELVHESVDENIVTDAVANIVSLSGKDFVKGHRGGAYNPSFYHLSHITPVATQLFGGILLFANNIDESQDTIFPPVGSIPVGNAGSPYAGANPYRGSYNQAESGVISSGTQPIGYRHVWDFNTDRANGTINCICLTSVLGGNTGWKSRKLFHAGNDAAFDTDSGIDVPLAGTTSLPSKPFATPTTTRNSSVIDKCLKSEITCRLLYVDEAEGYIYFALPGSTTNPGVIIRVKHAASLSVGLLDSVNPYEGGTHETYLTMGKTSFKYLNFIEFDKASGNVRYIETTSTSAFVDEIYHPTAGLVSSKTISIAGSGSTLATSPSVPPFFYKGFYYVQTNDSKLLKVTDTGSIEQTFDIAGLTGGQYIAVFSEVLDRVILRTTLHSYSYPGVAVLFDGVTLETFRTGENETNALACFANCSNPVGPGMYLSISYIYSAPQAERLMYQFFSNYLATINNLATPVIKTSSTTMKITYDLYSD